ncbi:BCCT family transporter [Psychroflexus tropicus]|uniref:BCCT family transporter n=1 Tax=Psychroflexus tropicus TaxID=197345 RepID=UPI00039FAFA4|nr:BCCT family transporter [Psychroflexus tropicus]
MLPSLQKKNRILLACLLVLGLLSIMFLFFPNQSFHSITLASNWIRSLFGGFYLVLGLVILVYLLVIAFSKFGKLKLGNDPAEYSTLSWLAMMYSTGMGAGIILRAVQEPVFMMQNPGIELEGSKLIHGLEMTFYHWGFTAWAFYGLFAVFIAYLLFVQKKNIQLSHVITHKQVDSIALPIDLLVILTTVFGIVSAVALGIRQLKGGLDFISDVELNFSSTIILCFLIFGLAITSSIRGLKRGIQLLSNLNIGLTLLLLAFASLQTDFSHLVSNFFNTSIALIIDFFPLSLAIGDFNFSEVFLSDWTYYYWAFWLAWAPFTGIFIARISKGRSLREMILGVLIVPSLGTFIWFTSFGTSAIELIESGLVSESAFENVFTATFVLLNQYPLGSYAVVLAVILLFGFLITSVDSAIFVLSMFSDLERINPSTLHKWLWGSLLFIFTLGFLVLGNFSAATNVLEAVQKLLIVSSLALALLCVVFMVFFVIRLNKKPRA